FGVPQSPDGLKDRGVETREDEEQTAKLADILELLLAAGYFRARIKGLSPFDKVVGGMTWCITTCNFDVDVDLLFQENSTIGQKIALTEKLVSVLPKMKCPHRLEPHQIQGLDFIHIFPVVQWLVKCAIETKEEMGDYVRAYSVSQFHKTHSTPEDDEFVQRKEKAVKTLVDVSEVYKPQRKYKRHADAGVLLDEESRVHSTLLEYGRFDTCSLMQGRLTASTVGHIVGMQSEEIKLMASDYADRQSERLLEDRSERYGPAQQHRRLVASLNKQIQQKSKHLEEVVREVLSFAFILTATELTEKLDKELSALEEEEAQADSSVLEKLRGLVAMNENLKNQEQEFRSHCREEMTRLQQLIENLKMEMGENGSDEKVVCSCKLSCSFEDGFENREIAILQRKIDEVPSRAELTQYQKRFIELYGQVSATHKETKQFFTLYNTLDDKKVFLEKEVSNIYYPPPRAMASSGAKEQFLRQMEQIVEGIKQNRMKMEKKKQENKMRRDQLNDEYLELLEKQRLYFKTIKDFKEECRKNEMLLSKLRAKGAS
uniref:Coiled-coil domain-containing protein 93 n=1 Tax=Scleropages formosus TaxID=113540 RepID=A0A8C9WJF2_SCLFO